jgi:hypothetical protein
MVRYTQMSTGMHTDSYNVSQIQIQKWIVSAMSRAGNEPSRARIGSPRLVHSTSWRKRLGSTLAREPARLAGHILVIIVALCGELTLCKFEI